MQTFKQFISEGRHWTVSFKTTGMHKNTGRREAGSAHEEVATKVHKVLHKKGFVTQSVYGNYVDHVANVTSKSKTQAQNAVNHIKKHFPKIKVQSIQQN